MANLWHGQPLFMAHSIGEGAEKAGDCGENWSDTQGECRANLLQLFQKSTFWSI